MLKSKILWALVLGVATSVLLVKAKINPAYSQLWGRIRHVLTAPGTHFAAALNTPGTLLGGSTRLWAGVAFACNLLIYVFCWYALFWTIGYVLGRKDPYERQNNTLVPPITR